MTGAEIGSDVRVRDPIGIAGSVRQRQLPKNETSRPGDSPKAD